VRVYSPKQLFDQFLTLYFKVSSNLIHDTAQSADSERFVSGNGDVMFKAFRGGCEPYMATGLASYLIAVPAQEGSELLTAHIPGSFIRRLPRPLPCAGG
jgi:hypothetical protein